MGINYCVNLELLELFIFQQLFKRTTSADVNSQDYFMLETCQYKITEVCAVVQCCIYLVVKLK